MKSLIVNADDFGLHTEINRGIIKGYQLGRTTLVVLGRVSIVVIEQIPLVLVINDTVVICPASISVLSHDKSLVFVRTHESPTGATQTEASARPVHTK